MNDEGEAVNDEGEIFYAVRYDGDAGGTVSVRLDGSNEAEATAAFKRDVRPAWVNDFFTDLEEDLRVEGDGLNEAEFIAAITAEGARRIVDLTEGWTLWGAVPPPEDDEDDEP